MEAQCVLCQAQTESLYVVQGFSLHSWLVALLLALLSPPPPHALPGSSTTDQFSSILSRCGHEPHKGFNTKIASCTFSSQDKITDYKGE